MAVWLGFFIIVLSERIDQLENQCPFVDACTERVHIRKGREMDLLVETYLRMIGLWDEVKNGLHSPASGLSIGQQQRLCLARALAVEPEMIFGDEPTSALDPISRQNIERILFELKKDYTIVLVTHILPQAKRIADYAQKSRTKKTKGLAAGSAQASAAANAEFIPNP